jgi:hypothetical protein
MASKRWDRGRRTRSGGALDIQGTLGTLLRTTLHQMGVVKDAVERQARSSLEQLDTAKLQRRRREALARLGEVVWELAVNGELGELGERSEVAALLDELEELEASAEEEGAGSAGEAVSSADWKPPARTGHAKGRRHHETMRVWRPNLDDHEPPPDSHAGAADAPAETAAPDPDERPTARARPEPTTAARSEPEPAPRGRGRRPAREEARAGGIAFMEDGPDEDDLAEYMNDEDVPRRK